MNKYDRYRMEFMRLSNNIQFYKHKIALCKASNARIFYEKLLAKEAKKFQELQLEYQRLDLRFQQLTPAGQDSQQNQEVLDTEPLEADVPNQEVIDSEPMEADEPNQEVIDSESMEADEQIQEVIDSEPMQADEPNQEVIDSEPMQAEQRVFTIEELSNYNGTGGQPAYVAVNGIVYDVSQERRWSGGTHFSMIAGRNLTMNFNTCHAGNIEVLKNLPRVGIMNKE